MSLHMILSAHDARVLLFILRLYNAAVLEDALGLYLYLAGSRKAMRQAYLMSLFRGQMYRLGKKKSSY